MVSKSGTERNKCELDLLIVIADGNIVNSEDINEEIYANWYSKSDILSLIANKKRSLRVELKHSVICGQYHNKCVLQNDIEILYNVIFKN